MKERLQELQQEAIAAVEQVASSHELRELKVKYLGRKGELALFLRGVGSLSPEERPVLGGLANEVRLGLDALITEREQALDEAEMQRALAAEQLDVTLPGMPYQLGSAHPLNLMIQEIEDFFVGLGYTIAEGPEVELDMYNFEMLNIPPEHPARDMQDSFYITDKTLLRTHTSGIQLRVLEERAGEVPVRIIAPGKVYRRDSDDATHSHQFTQCEGLVVDRNISLANLQGTLQAFLQHLFGTDTKVRFRPSFFPFTEPSLEVDIWRPERGWLEVMGAGMVHPKVLDRVGYNSDELSGFAFGLGIERMTMIKYGIEDIRHFYKNDLRFLRQFIAG